MTTKYNAQALMDEVRKEHPRVSDYTLAVFAAQRAIERHEAFRQEVSDAVVHCRACSDPEAWTRIKFELERFIPKPKPDPLVEVLHEVDTGPEWDSPEDYCNKIRAALDARGLTITTLEKD